MRRLAWVLLLCSCSDDERPPVAAGKDAATATDAVASDTASGCFWTDGTVPTVPYRLCNTNEDCVVVSHQTDCCGNTKLMGLAKSQQTAFNMCESSSRARFPECGCAAGPPTTDDGKVVATGTTPKVACTDVTDAGGICKTTAP